MPLALFFFLKIVFAVQGLLCCHANFGIVCSGSVKNAIGILLEIALNLQIALGSMVILTILILPIQEHSVSFHLIDSSSISFMSVIHFLEHRSFASLGRFIPRYFILSDVMVNGTVSLISLCDISLSVYRNATDFFFFF